MEKNNLDTLRILFIIKAVLSLLTTLFLMFVFFGMGAFIAQDAMGPPGSHGEFQIPEGDLPFNPLALIASLGIFVVIYSLAMTVITFMAAKYIGERRKHTFILVVSILNLISGILGLALGIFALIEINKPNVQPLFQGKSIPSDEVL